MASQYYGLNRGQTEFSMTSGTSTGSVDVELRYDLTKSLTKSEILAILEQIRNQIIKDNYPPN